ncbi:MAG: DUF1501 domain-containing protein, partial [Planctomycetota bacterium]|nr:DUF1501 domain-containing protein [Planctomycetota bacterium]
MNHPEPNPRFERELHLTRRRFFGLGAASVGALMGKASLAGLAMDGALGQRRTQDSLPGLTHIPAKAKRIIYMHMEGGPSHLDLFDYKPNLHERFDQDLPESVRDGQRLTGMTSEQKRFPVAPSMFEFKRYANNQDGAWISELMPHMGGVADKICIVRSMHTDAINHEPAITFFQTGNQLPGRPSFGSWCSYGLGDGNQNL